MQPEECSFFRDLFISVIGAGIGILGSLYIFRETIRKDRENAEEHRRLMLKNRMKWLKELILSVVTETNKQSENYIDQAEGFLVNPYSFYYVKLLASNQIDRLLKIDSQILFEAFLDKFNDDEATVKSYKDMLVHIDFISKSLKMVHETNEVIRIRYSNNIENFRVKIDSFYSNFLVLKTDDRTTDAVADVLTEYWIEFQNYIGVGTIDLKAINEFFIAMFNKIKEASVNGETDSSHIIVPIREITTLLAHLSSTNKRYALDDALKVKLNLSQSIAFMRDLSNKL